MTELLHEAGVSGRVLLLEKENGSQRSDAFATSGETEMFGGCGFHADTAGVNRKVGGNGEPHRFNKRRDFWRLRDYCHVDV